MLRSVGNSGRITRWLKGKPSASIDETISSLKNGSVITPIKDNCILINGWLPSLNPAVQYDLELEKDGADSINMVPNILGYNKPIPGYRILNIRWINIVSMSSKIMAPIIDFAASKCGKIRQKNVGLIRVHFGGKRWKAKKWDLIDQVSVKDIWRCLPMQDVISESSKAIIIKCISSIFDKSILVSPWSNIKWLEHSMKIVETKKWQRLLSNPELILLQGEDYLPNATIEDYKCLLLHIGRELPNEIQPLIDSNLFIKN